MAEEQRRFEEFRGRFPLQKGVVPDGEGITPGELDGVFSKLGIDKKLGNYERRPTPLRGEIYMGDALHEASGTPSAPNVRGYVGSTYMNYAREEVGPYPHHETLAVTQRKEAGIDRGDYRRDEPEFIEKYYRISDGTLHRTEVAGCISFDAGHGVDHAHTITHKKSNSTRDRINFTAQNIYYNRVIRRSLTGLGGRAKRDGHSYKEIAIYSQKPLMITRKHHRVSERVPIPEGFLLMLYNRISGSLVTSYYFPNLIDYEALLPTPKPKPLYPFFRNYFLIPNRLVQDVWEVDVIDGEESRRRSLWKSELVGYRSLSGGYEVLPERIQDRWTPAERNALIRSSAIQRMQRAAEYDDSVENMVSIARLFNDNDFVYLEFSGTLYHPDLAKYWTDRALQEIRRKRHPNKDIFYVLDEKSNLPITTGETKALVDNLERNLRARPSTTDIIKLIEFYEEENNNDKYNEWSDFLTMKTREGRIEASRALTKDNLSDLSSVEVTNAIIDLDLSSENIEEFIETLKRRAIRETIPYESNFQFIELRNITRESFRTFMEFLEYGFDYEGKELFLDVRGTALKLPQYERESVRKYVRNFPKTLIKII